MLNLLPVTTSQLVLVDGVGGDSGNSGFISALPVVLADDAKDTITDGQTVAADGSVILVYPSTYTGSTFTLSKAVHIIGTAKGGCIAQATASAFAYTVTVTAENATMENFTIKSHATSQGCGLYLDDTKNFVGRNLNIEMTASIALRYALACDMSTTRSRIIDCNITSDWDGVSMDGTDNIFENTVLICSGVRAGSIMGMINKSARLRLSGCTISVTNNSASSTGVIGFKNDTTGGAGPTLLVDCFVSVLEDHADSTSDAVAVKAEVPMILRSCNVKAQTDGSGDSYGIKATDDVTLINCNITASSGSGSAYSISVASGKTVTCVGCTYDRDAITGDGTVVDLMDADGRVDVGLILGVTPTTLNVTDGIVESNLKQIDDDTQSATDLKDFADTGYDPSTHKVQGVVLTDTCTTNTDMVSEPPTAAAIVNEWETQSQADPTGFHVNVMEVYGSSIQQTGGYLKVKNDAGNTILSTANVNVSSGVVQTDVVKLAGNADAATDLLYQAQFLLGNECENLFAVADGSVIAHMLAIGGDVSDFNGNTDSMEAVANSVATVDTEIATLIKLSEADTKIDKTTDSDAWRIVFYEKGTANVLMTKLVKDVDGTAVASQYTVIGQQVEAP